MGSPRRLPEAQPIFRQARSAYGLWSGASIHEIAQVAAASFQNSQQAGEVAMVALSTFLLTIALAAMGLETDVSKLHAQGLRPAILGALAFLFIAAFSLALIKFAG